MTTLKRKLESKSGLKLQLTINDNRSTMLSVKWEPGMTKVSLHRMFLQAPSNVMDDLACYLMKKGTIIAPMVKAFIADNLPRIDYSDTIDRRKIYSQGHVHNLKRIYDDLNREYFKGALSLNITWFGKPNNRPRSRVTFGLYHDTMKLIKVNRVLDNPSYPDYLVSYVVYHEMVHHVCPPYYNAKGQYLIHSKEFKQMEERFKHYEMATSWIQKNQANFFI